jgi:hypothetical protein
VYDVIMSKEDPNPKGEELLPSASVKSAETVMAVRSDGRKQARKEGEKKCTD